RAEIRKFAEDVADTIDNHEAVQFRETQREVRRKIERFISRHSQIERPLKPTFSKLVTALSSEVHASSLWSATKNEGHGRMVNLYQYFGVYARQDAKASSSAAINGLIELLDDILDGPGMKGTDMRRSRKFVMEVMEAAKEKHLEFLKQTRVIG